ncbi:PAS domain-containing sensor histidine kinase [Winogradskyella vincentii]|uniref:histidine kinase n=1 Tax=Winogradskyella vincentii TaxID=2877122 RepID=A0ABS7XWP7_9FLAO|nr:PAS domain S-box protein [Winogradskyella vincentii]MCA0152071.1 PAS domain S-box protein [Winogradskyella vincentii]
MSQDQLDIYKRALEREKQARKEAEKILEEKSRELFQTSQKLEELLIEKSNQLQGIFENIVDAYVIMDVNGNILKFNDAATQLFGYNLEKENITAMDLLYKEDIHYAMESYKELINKGHFKDYEARILTKNNEVRWVHINASLVKEKNNVSIAAQGIVRDITETKQISETLEEQKSELDAIVQNSSIGIVLTQNGKIVRTNDSIQKTLGYTEEELSKLTVKDISFPEDFPQSQEHITKMDAGEIDNFVLHKRYKKKNDSVLWAKTTVSAVRDNKGNIKYQVALVEDVTFEREQALVLDLINDVAKSLLGKMDIYEIAWEITNNIAQYLDSKDCVIYILDKEKNTLEQISAYGNKINADNEIENKITLPIGDGIVGSVARSGVAEIISDTRKDNRYVVDDEIRLSEITVPIISDGEVIGIIDAEHPLKNYFTKEHLKTLVNIASLVAMQLKSAINLREREKVEYKNMLLLDALGKSNDELQEYAHIVSHDLKSPLRSIDALVNWIKEDNKDLFDEVSKQNFALIETTLEKMEQLISDILIYSSIGNELEDSREVDLNSVIAELKQILFVPDHISIEVLNKLPVIKGDRTKLQQLFQNLISNAIKFNNKNNGLIEIDVKDEKSYYQFSVKDNGIGIEKEYHDNIFKIFHSLKKSKESTGIGLSIVKKVVDLYKGDIWLESEPNEGTTFHFTLKK